MTRSEPSGKLRELRAKLLAAAPDWSVAAQPVARFRFRKRKHEMWVPRGRSRALSTMGLTADSLDWRSGGRLFEPLDQGTECNTCTGHAMASLMGDLSRLNGTGIPRPLSPNFLHICIGGKPCKEAPRPGKVADGLLAVSVPLIRDRDTFDGASCSTAAGILKLSAWYPLYSAQDAMSALQRGPIYAVMELYDDFWSFYAGGIYRHTAGDHLASHSIEIVGYDRPAGHWIVKNSQGTGWGERGYARVAFGECRIFTPGGNGGMQFSI